MGNAACPACTASPRQASRDIVVYDTPRKSLSEEPVARRDLFRVVVDRTSGQALGLDVDIDCDAILLVVAVTGGAIAEWNEWCRNSGCEVKPGDHIVAVNGRGGSAEELLRHCNLEGLVELTLQHQGAILHSCDTRAPDDSEGDSPGTLRSATLSREDSFSSVCIVPLDSL
mmetsp:Transcript_103970/g.291250  ORF Transcript_103970/g.291250 Transcript_103970/m.291250 type:complete len:171 (-) Transcript_103970:245-757(-)